MGLPNVLEVECKNCKVSASCPERGSSPLMLLGKRIARCRLVGGYGRTPIPKEKLSQESLEKSKRDGECITIAEIPRYHEHSGNVYYDVVKIFAPANLHARENVTHTVDSIYPKSHS